MYFIDMRHDIKMALLFTNVFCSTIVDLSHVLFRPCFANYNRLRVIRTLKFNCRWAAKLEKQKAKRLAREQAKKEREAAAAKAKQEQEERAKINPFSAPAGGANAGLGGLLFGGSSDNPFATAAAAAPASATHVADEAQDSDDESGDESDEGDEESESERLAEELALKSDLAASAPTAESTWVESSTRYPPLYLNTVPEPCSSSLSKKLSKQEAAMLKSASASGALTTTDSAADDADLKGFAKEGYEKMLLDGIDDTFERFLKRVSVEPRQAVRYEFGGQPIAFHAKGKIYDLLWPKEYQPKAGQGVAVTKGQFTAGSAAPGERSFSARAVPPCQQCGAERVFEAQLMPNLINLLRADQIQAADGSLAPDALEVSLSETQDEEAKRKAAIEQALGRRLPGSAEGNGQKATTGDLTFDARTGLVWSTAFVFVCKNDCCNGELHGDDECWQEEVVLAQFEDEQ